MNWRGKIQALPIAGSAMLGLVYLFLFTTIRDPLIILIWVLLMVRGLLGLLRRES